MSAATSTLVRVTCPLSTSSSSPRAANILSAPARAANIIFTCCDTWAIGLDTCFVYWRKETNEPRSNFPAMVKSPPTQHVIA